jgi:hypothetical protein
MSIPVFKAKGGADFDLLSLALVHLSIFSGRQHYSFKCSILFQQSPAGPPKRTKDSSSNHGEWEYTYKCLRSLQEKE